MSSKKVIPSKRNLSDTDIIKNSSKLRRLGENAESDSEKEQRAAEFHDRAVSRENKALVSKEQVF